MHCITTKFLGPTNTKGSRIVARSHRGSRVIPYDCALAERANHHTAAVELAYMNGWIRFADIGTAQFQGACLPSEDGYAFLVPNE